MLSISGTHGSDKHLSFLMPRTQTALDQMQTVNRMRLLQLSVILLGRPRLPRQQARHSLPWNAHTLQIVYGCIYSRSTALVFVYFCNASTHVLADH